MGLLPKLKQDMAEMKLKESETPSRRKRLVTLLYGNQDRRIITFIVLLGIFSCIFV